MMLKEYNIKLWVSVILLVALLAGVQPVVQSAQKEQPLDRVVAVVNNQIITASELNNRMEMVKRQARGQNRDLPDNERLRHQILQQMVRQRLQLQIAKRQHVQATQNQLNKQIRKIAQQNNMTLSQFKQKLNEQGIDYKQYRHHLKQQMTVSMMQQKAVSSKVHIADSKVKSFLKNYRKQPHSDSQFHTADIFVPLPDNPTPQAVKQAKKRAKAIAHKLKQGADFHKVAVAQSSGQNVLKGGDMGWRYLGEMPDIFTHHLVTMQPGDIAGPVRAPNGFHILKLIDIKQTQGDVNAKQAKRMLFKRQFNQQLQSWLRQLRRQAYIKIMLDDKSHG